MDPLWTPSETRIAHSRLAAFMRDVSQSQRRAFHDYEDLHRFSIEQPADFWRSVWRFCGIRGQMGDQVVIDLDRMPGARFFPGARLNFAENVLRRRDDAPAIVFNGEGRRHRTTSHAQLLEAVARFAAALRRADIRPGDRVGGYLPNMPEAIIAALGAAAIGAVWSSCSPDFGIQGVLDRFGQIEPRVLIGVDGYFYGGKALDVQPRLAEVARALPSVEHTVVVPYVEDTPSIADIREGVLWDDWIGGGDAPPLTFEQLPFDHPLYILYSSGTTGVPKCIVHGAGGTLIQHLKEHQLHCDIQRDDRVFYFTTCGWMMWNWLVTSLALGSTIVLYDGAPFSPKNEILWDMAESERITVFGTSAKYLGMCEKHGLVPGESHDLTALRTILSTGSPLENHSFDYVYSKVKEDVDLASISGGTDIVSCFAGGNPIAPVYRGELQTRALGMAVHVFNDLGKPVVEEPGELVCTRPFVSMPVSFWNDPDGSKYRAAYFERYPNVWRHGDWSELTEHDGMIIYGRSDATLNPGGVRIGTAEIYRQVEQLPEIVESLVIGQDWPPGEVGDVRVVLFVKLQDGIAL